MSKSRQIDAERLAAMFKALGHPHRLVMLMRLLGCCGGRRVCLTEGEAAACVGELGEGLGVGGPTLSHHLKELKAAGLIETTRNGQMVECRAATERLGELAAFLRLAQEAVERSACCAPTAARSARTRKTGRPVQGATR